ncbi:MFS general substrate transporter [Corynespora cassiicola Philippines]|uniref:MFS general substrate transporter n=1 Tax=Corynespora cassiicola Philippines TaxID=1448308 RepID=A0A2T2NRR1_CORCC|nr:MFS general substrate transporter [Corynespora cassiicola Philippines]
MAPNEFEMETQTPASETPNLISRQGSDIHLESNSQWHEGIEHESSLPPVDGGKDAWLFLSAAFLLEVLVWGFPYAYGIFQDYYSTNAPFAGSRNIAIIGTCAMGLMYLSAPLVFGTLQRYPRTKRPAIMIGLLIMCLSLGLSSLSQTVTHLIITQGVFYAIGGAMAYSPAIQFMDEWFVAKKGFAFGVMWAGTGIGGVVIPLLLQWLLNNYGFRTTLRAWAIILFVSTAPVTLYLKPRLPISASTSGRRISFTFLRDRVFLLLQLGNVLEGLGYFLPSIYLPTFASQLGANSTIAALTLILFNVASVFGNLLMGTIIDRFHVTAGILFSTVGSTLSVFLIWGFANSLPPLFVFAFMYGFFAGCYSATWPGVMKAVQTSTGRMDGTMVFAALAAGRGIGNVVSGPVSEALVRFGTVGHKGVYGTEYGPLVLFTGISAVLGGAGILGKRIGWM